jgi:hypothetical protein
MPAEQFTCNWVLLPDYEEVAFSINYTMMLPGEQLLVYAEGDDEPISLTNGDGQGGLFTRFLTIKTMGIQFQFVPSRYSDNFEGGYVYDFWIWTLTCCWDGLQ